MSFKVLRMVSNCLTRVCVKEEAMSFSLFSPGINVNFLLHLHQTFFPILWSLKLNFPSPCLTLFRLQPPRREIGTEVNNWYGKSVDNVQVNIKQSSRKCSAHEQHIEHKNNWLTALLSPWLMNSFSCLRVASLRSRSSSLETRRRRLANRDSSEWDIPLSIRTTPLVHAKHIWF